MELPFYYTAPIPTFLGSDVESRANFNKAELFCLKTKLYPLVHSMLGKDKEISFRFIRKDDLSVAELIILDGSKIMALTPLQQNKIMKKARAFLANTPKYHGLVIGNDSIVFTETGSRMDPVWIQSMFKYIKIHEKHELYLTDDGLYADLRPQYDQDIIDGKIKDYDSPQYSHEEYHVLLITQIIVQLKNYYQQGYIADPSLEVVQTWDLTCISTDGRLYYPKWSCPELVQYYSGITSFLLSRQRGINEVYLPVKHKENYATRHLVSVVLNQLPVSYTFLAKYLILANVGLEQVRLIMGLVDYLVYNITRKVVVYRTTDSEQVPLSGSPVIYTVLDNPDAPIAVSAEISMLADPMIVLRNGYEINTTIEQETKILNYVTGKLEPSFLTASGYLQLPAPEFKIPLFQLSTQQQTREKVSFKLADKKYEELKLLL